MDLFAACERGAAAGCCCARAAEPSSRLKEIARQTPAKYPNVDPAMRSRMGTSYWSRTRDQACVRCVLIRFTRKVLCAKKPQGRRLLWIVALSRPGRRARGYKDCSSGRPAGDLCGGRPEAFLRDQAPIPKPVPRAPLEAGGHHQSPQGLYYPAVVPAIRPVMH